MVYEYGACIDILTDYFQLSSDEILQDIKTENLIGSRSESEDSTVPKPETPVTQPSVSPNNPTQIPVHKPTQNTSANFQTLNETTVNDKSPKIPNTGFDFDISFPVVAVCSFSVMSLLLKRKSRGKETEK